MSKKGREEHRWILKYAVQKWSMRQEEKAKKNKLTDEKRVKCKYMERGYYDSYPKICTLDDYAEKVIEKAECIGDILGDYAENVDRSLKDIHKANVNSQLFSIRVSNQTKITKNRYKEYEKKCIAYAILIEKRVNYAK